MKTVEDLVGGLAKLQERMMFHHDYPLFRRVADDLYLRRLQDLRDLKAFDAYRDAAAWYKEFVRKYGEVER